MNVLIIDGYTVVNVICADSVERAREFHPGMECREQSGAAAMVGPGWVLTEQGWTPPVPVVQPPVPLTRYEFLTRFTMPQRIAIREAAKTDPVIADAMGMVDIAAEVQLDSPDTQMFVGYLAQQGLIPSVAQILGGAQ
jgi:hypothetical protein